MGGIERAVSLLASSAGSPVRPGDAADDALLELLVHVALQDGVVDDAEIGMLQRVLPGWTDARVRAWLADVAARPLDLDRLAAALDDPDRAWTALRFAARMAARDDGLDASEQAFLHVLAGALALPQGAAERVVAELARRRLVRVEPAALRAAVDASHWAAPDFAEGPVRSLDLAPLVPPGATGVLRVGVDQTEVLGLYDQGLVGRFLEGPAFVRWSEIVGCARGSGLAASVRLLTEDGRAWSVVDARLAGIQAVIDRLGRAAPPAAPTPDPPEGA